MASVRPTPQSYYYSGQGRLGIGDRNPTTGKLSGLLFIGNVTSLSIDIEVQKFEHKESMTGNRATDVTIIQEKKAKFKFNSESLKLDLLAQGLYGDSASVTGGTVAAEKHLAQKGKAFPLDHQNVTDLTSVKTTEQTPATLVEGTDYTVDLGFGTVYIDIGTSKVPSEGVEVEVEYTYGAYDKLEAFTTGTPPERYLRFEGLNTVNGDLRTIDIYRGSFDPLTGLEFINEELGAGEFNGSVLPDTTITQMGLSQFFRERRVLSV